MSAADGGGAWSLTAHACRQCFARVLRDGAVFRCSTCAAEAQGGPEPICGCGTLAGVSDLPGERRGVFRCAPNPAPSPRCPALVVITFGGGEEQPGA